MLRKPINKIKIFDGAMGTELASLPESKGHVIEEMNILYPSIIQRLHRRYCEAGAEYITTNTFSVSPVKWQGSTFHWKDVADAAIVNARRASKDFKAEVMFDIGPSGRMMEPVGDFLFEAAYENVKSVVEHVRDRVDGFIIETFSDLYEIRAAILAVKENSDLPLFATMTFDESGRTLTGSTPEIVAYTLTAIGADAIGINCSNSPEKFVDIVKKMRPFTHLPVITQPNMGLPVMRNGKTCYDYTDSEFAKWTKKLIEAGTAIIGGCCGTSPSTIKAIAEFKGLPVKNYDKPEDAYICSSTCIQRLQKGIICGERLNPTGKKKLREALLNQDFDYLQKEAVNQKDRGANFLDLNVGIAECDEKILLCKAAKRVQEVCELPLQLDSSNVEALEAAIRIYNGVPMINSMNGSAESLNALLPVLAKYGTPSVVLPLDDKGIPETPDERIKIAKHIIRKASESGIDKRQLVFDALVMTVASNQSHGQTTIDTLRELKKLGVLTIMGLSNVSYGLPQRTHLNSTFLAMALEEGLDIPIVNPLDADVVQTVLAFNALSGIDVNCERYISFNTGEEQTIKGDSLYHAIILGLKDDVAHNINNELKSKTPEMIIADILVPALAEVGNNFEKKTIFLPQLIRSAEAAKAAFEILSGKYVKDETGNKGTIVMATVKGDNHDIGKNIVKVVVESHGYRVIDLGKNVDKETIADTCSKYHPMAVGLSALMTTTVKSMTETIAYLHQQQIDLPIMVGGAVITQETASEIGADYYSKDALAAVNILEHIGHR